MALTRDDVITKAVEVLDRDGLDGLTLRRLAKELGISAPTLYWHVRDKRELLDLVAERITTGYRESLPPLPPGLEWWEIVAEGLRRQYHALISHRDAARVVAGNRPTTDSLPTVERWLGVWIAAGFSPEEAFGMVLAGGNYVLGSALEYQAEVERAEMPKKGIGALRAEVDKFPNLKRAIEARRAGRLDRHSVFEIGLSLFIAGVRARHAELAAEAKA